MADYELIGIIQFLSKRTKEIFFAKKRNHSHNVNEKTEMELKKNQFIFRLETVLDHFFFNSYMQPFLSCCSLWNLIDKKEEIEKKINKK